MDNSNQHIIEYLNWYLHAECCNPQFAVLLKGSWGSGKTYFIKEYMSTGELCSKTGVKKLKDEFIYISLYGIQSTAEIDDLIFQQLHPVLSSKGMAVTGKIIKSALKIGLKFDWNGDGKADGTATCSVPDVKISECLSNFSDRHLVFDDLERCDIPLDSLLGYVNYFVEHAGQKVILLANDDEIEKQLPSEEVGKDSRYHKIKEKVIGKSFAVESEKQAVVMAVIEQKCPHAHGFLINHVDYLCKVLEAVQKSDLSILNYRAFSHALGDFDRVYKSLHKRSLLQKYSGFCLLWTI